MSFSIYLAGPMKVGERSKWRREIRGQFPESVQFNDPEDFEKGKYFKDYQHLVQKDLQMINLSTIVLVNITRHSTGTPMEMVYAYQMHKPMYVVCEEESLISSWHRYHCANMFYSDIYVAAGTIIADFNL